GLRHADDLDETRVLLEVIDAEDDAVEPLQERSGRQQIGREARLGCEGRKEDALESLESDAQLGERLGAGRELVEAHRLAAAVGPRERDRRRRSQVGGQSRAQIRRNLVELGTREELAVELPLGRSQRLPLELLAAVVVRLPDQHSVAEN